MNFYSSCILSVVTYIIFNIFLPPHFYSKSIILMHKIPHILRILTLSFYDNYYELEFIFFSFLKQNQQNVNVSTKIQTITFTLIVVIFPSLEERNQT